MFDKVEQMNEHNSKLIFALTTKKTKKTPTSYVRALDMMFKSREEKNERHLIYGNTSILSISRWEDRKNGKVISSPVG